MKALKEKRLSLLSLWRRGLIILSLMALVFASCGNKSGDPASPGEPSGGEGSSGKVPMSLQIVNGPSATEAFEGLLVDLTGIRLIARYTDNTYAYITDVRQLSVSPFYYDSTIGKAGNLITEYVVSYKEGGKIVSTGFGVDAVNGSWVNLIAGPKPEENAHELVEIVYTGNLLKQEYFVDDIPDFKGVVIEGRYGTGTAGPSGGSAGTEFDYIQKQLPVTSAYPWRWVFNHPDPSAIFENQDPGILLSIGGYGNPTTNNDNNDQLTGLRIPVTTLYQVKSFEFATAPSFSTRNIYFDDPSLFDTTVLLDDWADILEDAKFTVSYTGTTVTKEYSLTEMRTMDVWGGLWPNADMGGLITYIQIGKTSTSKWQISAPSGTFAPFITSSQSVDALTKGSPGDNPDAFQWASWSVNKEPRLYFEYRGKSCYVVVPIYNKLSRIDVASKTGDAVVMDGAERVYHRGNDFDMFRSLITVSATYTLNTDSTQLGVREDVDADFKAGRLRGVTELTIGTSLQPDLPDAPAIRRLPYATTNVFQPKATFTGILTLANSTAYLDKGKEQKANVTFHATRADNDFGTSKSGNINIGVLNYLENNS